MTILVDIIKSDNIARSNYQSEIKLNKMSLVYTKILSLISFILNEVDVWLSLMQFMAMYNHEQNLIIDKS